MHCSFLLLLLSFFQCNPDIRAQVIGQAQILIQYCYALWLSPGHDASSNFTFIVNRRCVFSDHLVIWFQTTRCFFSFSCSFIQHLRMNQIFKYLCLISGIKKKKKQNIWHKSSSNTSGLLLCNKISIVILLKKIQLIQCHDRTLHYFTYHLKIYVIFILNLWKQQQQINK